MGPHHPRHFFFDPRQNVMDPRYSPHPRYPHHPRHPHYFADSEKTYKLVSSFFQVFWPQVYVFLQKQLFSKNTTSGCLFSCLKHCLITLEREIQGILKCFTQRYVGHENTRGAKCRTQSIVTECILGFLVFQSIRLRSNKILTQLQIDTD